MNTYIKKGFVAALTAILMFTSTPAKAFGYEIVFDPADIALDVVGALEQFAGTLLQGEDFSKEYILDPASWVASGMNLQTMAQSMTNFVSSGFNGSPGFVTNLQEHLLQVGDAGADNFVQQLLSDGSIESPFRDQVVNEAGDIYRRSTGPGAFSRTREYTLDNTCQNDAAFISGDFFSCGLSGFRTMLSDPLANTPEGSRIAVIDAVLGQAAQTQETSLEELSWGDGIRSWRGSCDGSSAPAEGTEGEAATETEATSLSSSDSSIFCSILTPASSVVAELQNRIGVATDQQLQADEISEVLASSILSFIGDEVFGEGGLLGDSGGSSSGGGGRDTTGSTQGAPPSLVNAFVRLIGNQTDRIRQYQEAWLKIKNQADAAKANLETCSSTGAQTALQNEVLPLITEATAELNKVTQILLIFEDIEARARAATTFVEFEEASKDYDNLITGNPPYENTPVPDANDIVDVTRESQDSGPVTEGKTKYTRMKELSEQRCSTID